MDDSTLSIVARLQARQSGFKIPSRARYLSATHLHLVSGLRMNGAIPPLPLYTFMACTEAALPFIFTGTWT